jgi:hypothetical protein
MAAIAAPSHTLPVEPVVSSTPAPVNAPDFPPARPRFRRLVVFTGRLP